MIKSIALWALGRLRTRVRMSGDQSELWDKFVRLVTEIF